MIVSSKADFVQTNVLRPCIQSRYIEVKTNKLLEPRYLSENRNILVYPCLSGSKYENKRMTATVKPAYDGSTALRSIMQEAVLDSMLGGTYQTDAYLEVHPKCKNRKVAEAAASRMLSNVRVKARLEYRRAELAEETGITAAYLRVKLLNLAKKAESAGKHTAAATCYAHLMKSIGGFQADRQPPENLISKALDAETTREVRKALDAVFQRKYLALPTVEGEVIDDQA